MKETAKKIIFITGLLFTLFTIPGYAAISFFTPSSDSANQLVSPMPYRTILTAISGSFLVQKEFEYDSEYHDPRAGGQLLSLWLAVRIPIEYVQKNSTETLYPVFIYNGTRYTCDFFGTTTNPPHTGLPNFYNYGGTNPTPVNCYWNLYKITTFRDPVVSSPQYVPVSIVMGVGSPANTVPQSAYQESYNFQYVLSWDGTDYHNNPFFYNLTSSPLNIHVTSSYQLKTVLDLGSSATYGPLTWPATISISRAPADSANVSAVHVYLQDVKTGLYLKRTRLGRAESYSWTSTGVISASQSGSGWQLNIPASVFQNNHKYTITSRGVNAGGYEIPLNAADSRTFSWDQAAPTGTLQIYVNKAGFSVLSGGFTNNNVITLKCNVADNISPSSQLKMKVTGDMLNPDPTYYPIIAERNVTLKNTSNGGVNTINVSIIDAVNNELKLTGSVAVDKVNPLPPTNLTSDKPSPNNGAFTLSWVASSDKGEGGSGLDVYLIRDSITGAFVFVNAASNSYSLKGKQLNDGDHTIRVTAIDKAGNISLPSNPLNVTIDSIPPSAPGQVWEASSASSQDHLQFSTDGDFYVNWTPVTDAASYKFYHRDSSGIIRPMNTTAPITNTYVKFSQTPDGIYGGYCVSAVDLSGNPSGYSPFSDNITVDTGTPQASVDYLNGWQNSTSVVLTTSEVATLSQIGVRELTYRVAQLDGNGDPMTWGNWTSIDLASLNPLYPPVPWQCTFDQAQENRAYQFWYRIKSNAGLWSSNAPQPVKIVKIDRTEPDPPIFVHPDPNVNTTNSLSTVSGTAHDALSGIGRIELCIASAEGFNDNAKFWDWTTQHWTTSSDYTTAEKLWRSIPASGKNATWSAADNLPTWVNGGRYTFNAVAYDQANNASSYRISAAYKQVTYNATAPIAQGHLNITTNPEWPNWSKTFDFSWRWDNDPGNIANYYYAVNKRPDANSPATNVQMDPKLTLPNNDLKVSGLIQGLNTLEVVPIDEAGNVDFTKPATCQFYFDSVAPAAPANPSATPNHPSVDPPGWELSGNPSWTVHWTNSNADQASGVDKVHYIIDNGNNSGDITVPGGATSFQLQDIGVGEGTHTLDFYFIDKAGNSNPTSTNVAIKCEQSGPKADTITATCYINAAHTQTINDYDNCSYDHPYFTWNGAQDGGALSGIAGYYVYFGQKVLNRDTFSDGDFTFQQNANYTVNSSMVNDGNNYNLVIKVKDNAGNISPPKDPFHLRYTGSGSVTSVSNPSIIRSGNTVGSAVNLSWQTDPANAAVDIFAKTGTFSALAADWPAAPAYSGITAGTKTDLNQVGQGTIIYFKIVPAGHALTGSDLTADVLCKFDLVINDGTNLISLPLIPADTNINVVIGNQLKTGTVANADKINYSYYDPGTSSTVNSSAYLSSADSLWHGGLTSIEPDKGYLVTRQAGQGLRYVTVVGSLFLGSSRNIGLYQGSNMVGTAYPVSIALNSSNLASVLTPGTVISSDKVNYYDNPSSSSLSAYLGTDGLFHSANLNSFEPGKGYYVNNQSLINSPNPDVWNYIKP